MVAQSHEQENAGQENDDDDANGCSGEELEVKMPLTKKPVAMRPKIDRGRLFSTVGTVAFTDRSTINAYKAAPCQPDFLQGHSTPMGPKAESVPNFYQVQTFRWRNETRAISVS
jgi:hypothetical protein